MAEYRACTSILILTMQARMRQGFDGVRIVSGESDDHPSDDFSGPGQESRRQYMSNSISNLLIRNLRDVFGESDPARRRAAIDELWAEDGVFYDPSKGAIRGRDEIDRVAGAVKATHPDFRYQVTAAPQEYCDGGMVPWISGRPGEVT